MNCIISVVFSEEVLSNFLRFYKLCRYFHRWCCLWHCRQKFTKSTGKHHCRNQVFQKTSGWKIPQNLCWSAVFNKVTDLQAAVYQNRSSDTDFSCEFGEFYPPATLLKIRFWHRCFNVNFWSCLSLQLYYK